MKLATNLPYSKEKCSVAAAIPLCGLWVGKNPMIKKQLLWKLTVLIIVVLYVIQHTKHWSWHVYTINVFFKRYKPTAVKVATFENYINVGNT